MPQKSFSNPSRPIVCIQGLGFVGAAMAIAVSSARDGNGLPIFNVFGVDLPNPSGLAAIAALNEGYFPIPTNDEKLICSTKIAHETGNLIATCDESVYGFAEVIVCDINLDLGEDKQSPDVDLESFEASIRTIGRNMQPGALVLIETTIPPGTCTFVVAPALANELESRNEPPNSFLLAHSFERVMPGVNYFDSIVNFWRVYAGHTSEAAAACRNFLEKLVNIRDFPLTELDSTTASEITKVMENSYRAVNIAFIEEWTRFAEVVKVDLFEVIEAIRKRPTHSNIMQPGFGVGGYCLTKDPLFAKIAANRFFDRKDLSFPFCEQAIEVNNSMPLASLQRLEKMLGKLQGKRIALFGVSYREDVADTRYSPSQTFYQVAVEKGALIKAHDPLVKKWVELGIEIDPVPPVASSIDAAVFAVRHREYREMDLIAWANGAKPIILDANNVLSYKQCQELRAIDCKVDSIGKGEK